MADKGNRTNLHQAQPAGETKPPTEADKTQEESGGAAKDQDPKPPAEEEVPEMTEESKHLAFWKDRGIPNVPGKNTTRMHKKWAKEFGTPEEAERVQLALMAQAGSNGGDMSAVKDEDEDEIVIKEDNEVVIKKEED